MSSINFDYISNMTQYHLNKSQSSLSETVQQLSTGKRTASEDVVQYIVGKSIELEQEMNNIGIKNIAHGKAASQVASSAINDIMAKTKDMIALTQNSISSLVSDSERILLNENLHSNIDDVDRIVSLTKFNGNLLLDGSLEKEQDFSTNIRGTDAIYSAGINFNDNLISEGNMFYINNILFKTTSGSNSNDSIKYTTSELDNATPVIEIGMNENVIMGNNVYNTTTSQGMLSAIAHVINNIESTNQQRVIDNLKLVNATVTGNTLNLKSSVSGIAGAFDIGLTGANYTSSSFDSVFSGGIKTSLDDIRNNIQANPNAIIKKISATVSEYNSSTGSMGEGNVHAYGNISGNILASLNNEYNSKATAEITLSKENLLNDQKIEIFGRTFTLKEKVIDSNNEISIVGNDDNSSNDIDTKKTLANIISYLNNSDDLAISRFNYEMKTANTSDLTLVITSKASTNKLDGTEQIIFSPNSFDSEGKSVTKSTILYNYNESQERSSVTSGIDVSTITDNINFLGKIDNFEARFAGDNRVELSVQVGDYKYSGIVEDTKFMVPQNSKIDSELALNTIGSVKLFSNDTEGNGGYFTLHFKNNPDNQIQNQDDANNFAIELNKALEGVTVNQSREIDSFDIKGSILEGGKIYANLNNFDNLNVTDIEIEKSNLANNSNAEIEIKLSDGRVFKNSLLGNQLHAGEKVVLTNTSNSDENLTIFTGKQTIDLSTDNYLENLQQELENGLKIDQGGIRLYTNLEDDDSLSLVLSSLYSKDLFANQEIDITTNDKAIKTLGHLQDAYNFLKNEYQQTELYINRLDDIKSNIETKDHIDTKTLDFIQNIDYAEMTTKLASEEVKVRMQASLVAKSTVLPSEILEMFIQKLIR